MPGRGPSSVDDLYAGTVTIDPAAAVEAAERFSVAAGHPGSATVDAGVVTVSVRYSVPTVVLGIVGVPSLRVSATASAVDLHGVTTGAP